MITDRLDLSVEEFRDLSGWEIKTEGACRGDVCIPLRRPVERADGRLDVAVLAEQLAMPVVHNDGHGLWAIGASSGGRVLDSAQLPDLVLSDFDGHTYDFASARGRKIVLLAWASW